MWRLSLAACALAISACRRQAPCLPGEKLSREECAQIASIVLPARLPVARGNAHGDDVSAATLGFQLFSDARLSAKQDVRCASCHEPERAFTDGQKTPRGFAGVHRNTPTVLNAARLSRLSWDGRADSVWSQALVPLENPAEMNFTRLQLAHRLRRSYRVLYERVFGPLPALDDSARFPPSGKPGESAWEAMTAVDRAAINAVAANVGKAFEAYLRKASGGPSRVDRYLSGEKSALGTQEVHGLAVLATTGCLGCHAGPMLSDERFHNLGVSALPGAPADPGQSGATTALALSDFSARGAFWDGAPPAAPADEGKATAGAFRTPPLRNLTRSAP